MNARRIVLFTTLLFVATPVFAQSSGRFTIIRHVIAGGGVTFSTNASFRLGGTLGQPASAAPSSSRFSIQGGFWILDVPVIFAPVKVGNTFILSFATEAGKTYTLQYTDSLSNPTWQSLPNVVSDGAVKFITNSAPNVPQRFYRVRVP